MNKGLNAVAARLSLVLIGVGVVFMVAFAAYLVSDRTREVNQAILSKGVSAATVGASVMGKTLDGAIDQGLFTADEVFDHSLVPIELPDSIAGGYAGIPQNELASVQKYRYSTGLDSYLDNAILDIEDEFLNDPQVSFAVLVDEHGYLPTDNSVRSQALTGDFARDRDNNQTKRLFSDDVGLEAARNTSRSYLRQVYQDQSGDQMWDISSPVYVEGRHWGAFRIGLSMDKTTAAISALRWKMVLPLALLLLALVVAITWATISLMKPLAALQRAAERLEKGNLEQSGVSQLAEPGGRDEISSLSRAFARMAAEVRSRETRLKTQVAELKVEIDRYKKARQVDNPDPQYFENLERKAREMKDKNSR